MGPTGLVDNWRFDPSVMGPIYPFVGWELLMLASCAAFFVWFMVWKFCTENAKYAAAARQLRDSGELETVLDANSPGVRRAENS